MPSCAKPSRPCSAVARAAACLAMAAPAVTALGDPGAGRPAAAAPTTAPAAPAAGAAADTQPAPLPFVEGSFTFVVLPDTQNYAESHPDQLEAQTRWIAENVRTRNIACVLQVGDLTNRNLPEQWENVRKAMRRLDGVVPYALATGNHDYGPGGDTKTRDSGINEFFSAADLERQPTFGGLYEPGKLDNSFHLVRAGGTDWLLLALEWGPRDAVLEWADGVLRRHPQRRAIVFTHAYLYSDDTRYDYATRKDHKWNPHTYPTAKLPGGTNDGQQIWDKLVSKHDNVDFVLCGHVLNDGAGRLASRTDGGHTVHQIMANYQDRPKGGEAYLRLMEFLPDGRTVQVKTYSPVLDRYMTDEQQQFVLKLDRGGGIERLGIEGLRD